MGTLAFGRESLELFFVPLELGQRGFRVQLDLLRLGGVDLEAAVVGEVELGEDHLPVRVVNRFDRFRADPGRGLGHLVAEVFGGCRLLGQLGLQPLLLPHLLLLFGLAQLLLAALAGFRRTWRNKKAFVRAVFYRLQVFKTPGLLFVFYFIS